MSLRLITPPADTLVTLDQARAQCRLVGIDDYNLLLQQLIDTSVQFLDGDEGVLGKALLTQTWELTLDRFPEHRYHPRYVGSMRPIQVPLPPLQAVLSVQYWDLAGTLQTLDPSLYLVSLASGRIASAPGYYWPRAQEGREDAIVIQFRAGYGDDAADVPAPLRQAILLLVSHLYAHPDAVVGVESRDSSTELPFGVTRFLSGRRTPRI